MGFNTTVVVLNDALDDIENDPLFGKKLAQAIRDLEGGRKINVSALNHGNAAQVIETHHSDYTVVVTVGGNFGMKQACTRGSDHRQPEVQRLVMEDWAKKLGVGVL